MSDWKVRKGGETQSQGAQTEPGSRTDMERQRLDVSRSDSTGGKTQTHTHTHEVEHFYTTENRHRSGLCSRSNLHGKYPDKSEDHTQQGDSVAHLSHVRTNSSRAAQLKIRKTSADTCGMKTKRQSTRPSWADFFGFWRAIHVIGRLCFLPSSAVGRSTESNDWARVFFDDREPQHNRGADDKHSLSEDIGMFFCFVLFCFNPGEQRRRERRLSIT